jgi:hypothetical protein
MWSVGEEARMNWRCMLCGGHLVGLSLVGDPGDDAHMASDRLFCGPCFRRAIVPKQRRDSAPAPL